MCIIIINNLIFSILTTYNSYNHDMLIIREKSREEREREEGRKGEEGSKKAITISHLMAWLFHLFHLFFVFFIFIISLYLTFALCSSLLIWLPHPMDV